MTIRQPRLLDSNLLEIARLSPVKLSLEMTLAPLSTAVMVLSPDDAEIAPRDLVELYDENGSAGIFRVKEVATDAGRTRTATLEHSLCTLRDGVIPAQGFMGSVREGLEMLLACQPTPLWTLGDVEAPDDLTLIFATEYASLLDALEAMLGMLPEGYAVAFDQSAAPWKLHLRRLSDEDACEGRLSRNVQTVRIESDGSRLCTRVYPFGAEVETGRISLVPLEGIDHLDSAAAEALGVISRTFANDLIFDVPTLHDVAQLYLDRHAQPETTIVVNAADLSSLTGEDFDAFRLGRMCRICLPEDGLILRQRITAVSRPDVCGAPGQAVLTLSSRMKKQTDAEEIDEMVRQITAGKLLGGVVTEVVNDNRAYGTYTSPIVHTFTVEDWAALLDVRVTFSPDSGVTIRDVRVDALSPEDEVWKGRSFSAMPYLKRDELGQIAQGEHWVSFLPYGSSATDSCGVSSTVTMTVIEKTTT